MWNSLEQFGAVWNTRRCSTFLEQCSIAKKCECIEYDQFLVLMWNIWNVWSANVYLEK
jgi:hypothetical protein